MSIDPLFILAITAIAGVTSLSARKLLGKQPMRLGESRDRADARLQGVETRLASLEQSVDVIALEIERIGESQRYLTKVLASQLPKDSDRPAPEHPTE